MRRTVSSSGPAKPPQKQAARHHPGARDQRGFDRPGRRCTTCSRRIAPRRTTADTAPLLSLRGNPVGGARQTARQRAHRSTEAKRPRIHGLGVPDVALYVAERDRGLRGRPEAHPHAPLLRGQSVGLEDGHGRLGGRKPRVATAQSVGVPPVAETPHARDVRDVAAPFPRSGNAADQPPPTTRAGGRGLGTLQDSPLPRRHPTWPEVVELRHAPRHR